jgi:dTMP kinase
MAGVFLVFEGSDGAGKSSQLRRLAARLEAEGHEVARLVEPSRGPLGTEIRQRAAGQGPPMSAQEELDLFVADRRENVSQNVLPALEQGQVVVQDRYFYSTAAYQSARPELEMTPGDVLALHDWAPRPDVVILLDLPVDEGLTRVRRRGAEDAFEGEDRQRKVRQAFLAMAEADPGVFRRIDASQTEEQVAEAVWRVVAPLVGAS